MRSFAFSLALETLVPIAKSRDTVSREDEGARTRTRTQEGEGEERSEVRGQESQESGVRGQVKESRRGRVDFAVLYLLLPTLPSERS